MPVTMVIPKYPQHRVQSMPLAGAFAGLTPGAGMQRRSRSTDRVPITSTHHQQRAQQQYHQQRAVQQYQQEQRQAHNSPHSREGSGGDDGGGGSGGGDDDRSRSRSRAGSYGADSLSVRTPKHVPRPDRHSYNKKWTDVAYRKYQLGMAYYRQRDFVKSQQCFQHVLRIRKSMRQDLNSDGTPHPDVVAATQMMLRIQYLQEKEAEALGLGGEEDEIMSFARSFRGGGSVNRSSFASVRSGRSNKSMRSTRSSKSAVSVRSGVGRPGTVARPGMQAIEAKKKMKQAAVNKKKVVPVGGDAPGAGGGPAPATADAEAAPAPAPAPANPGWFRRSSRNLTEDLDSDDEESAHEAAEAERRSRAEAVRRANEQYAGWSLGKPPGAAATAAAAQDSGGNTTNKQGSDKSSSDHGPPVSGSQRIMDELQNEVERMDGPHGKGKGKTSAKTHTTPMSPADIARAAASAGAGGKRSSAGGAARGGEADLGGFNGLSMDDDVHRGGRKKSEKSSSTDSRDSRSRASGPRRSSSDGDRNRRSSADGDRNRRSSADGDRNRRSSADGDRNRRSSADGDRPKGGGGGAFGVGHHPGIAADGEDAHDDDEPEEEFVDDAFETFSARSLMTNRPKTIVVDKGERLEDDRSYVSAMQESTATAWIEEQSLMARSVAEGIGEEDEEEDDDEEDEVDVIEEEGDEGQSGGYDSVTEFRKFMDKARRESQQLQETRSFDGDGDDKKGTPPLHPGGGSGQTPERKGSWNSNNEWRKFVAAAKRMAADHQDGKVASPPDQQQQQHDPAAAGAAAAAAGGKSNGRDKAKTESPATSADGKSLPARTVLLERQPSTVSTMADTTASDWRDEQSLVARRKAAALAHHRRGKYDEDAHDKDDLALNSDDFSLGNAAFRAGEYETARNFFLSALRSRSERRGHDEENGGVGGANPTQPGAEGDNDDVDLSLTQERLGDAYVQLGEVQEAHGHYQQALRTFQSRLGRNHVSVSRVMVSIGDLYFCTGNYSRALKYYDKALGQRLDDRSPAKRAGDPGGGHHGVNAGPSVLECAEKAVSAHGALAGRAIECADREMTLFHYREVLWLARLLGDGADGGRGDGHAKVRHKDKPTVSGMDEEQQLDEDVRSALLTGVHTAALSKEDVINDPDSRSYLKEAMRLLQLTGATGTTEGIASVMDNITSILIKEKKADSALRCLEEKLDMLRRERGTEKHRDVADCLCKLGHTAGKFNKHDMAVGYYERAVRINRKLSKRNKGDLNLAIRGLASSQLAVGNHTIALKCYRDYLSVCTFDEKAVVLNTMGIIYSKLYKMSEALDCYTEALQIVSPSSHGARSDDKETLASITNLQEIFLSPKKRPKEKDCFEKALDSQDMKNVLINLGLAQLKRRSSTKTKSLVREVLKRLDFDRSMSRVDLACVLKSMGNVLSRRRRYREATEYYSKCLRALQQQRSPSSSSGGGPNSQPPPQERFELLTDLGTAYLKMGENDKSFGHFKHALEELKRCHVYMKGEDGAGSGVSRHSPLMKDQIRFLATKNGDGATKTRREALQNCHLIGLALCRFGMYDDAVRTLDAVLARTAEAYGDDSPDAAKLCIDMSSVCLLRGDLADSRRIFDGGMQRLQREKIPYHHPFMSQLRRLYGWHYASGGQAH